MSRFLHPPIFLFLLILLVTILPDSEAIECLNYRVPQGQPIPKAVRNPRCNSKADYCVKITGNTFEGNHPFIAGRCEYVDECREYGQYCFTRSDTAGKTEEVCCSKDNFSNHGSSSSASVVFQLLLSMIILAF